MSVYLLHFVEIFRIYSCIMKIYVRHLSLRQTIGASQRLANATGSAWHHKETGIQVDGPGDRARDLQVGIAYVHKSGAHLFL